MKEEDFRRLKDQIHLMTGFKLLKEARDALARGKDSNGDLVAAIDQYLGKFVVHVVVDTEKE